MRMTGHWIRSSRHRSGNHAKLNLFWCFWRGKKTYENGRDEERRERICEWAINVFPVSDIEGLTLRFSVKEVEAGMFCLYEMKLLVSCATYKSYSARKTSAHHVCRRDGEGKLWQLPLQCNSKFLHTGKLGNTCWRNQAELSPQRGGLI